MYSKPFCGSRGGKIPLNLTDSLVDRAGYGTIMVKVARSKAKLPGGPQ